MLRRASAAIAALLLSTSVAGHSQQTDTTRAFAEARAAFDSIVSANTYHLTLEDGELRGEGVEWLEERARGAHHFMIGERHGTAEIPAVAASLYERLADLGYDYTALEIGPFAARHVNRALDRGGFGALSELLTRYDAAPVAFMAWREEARMAARIADAGGTIWGLDQEFVRSLPMHLDALAEEAETAEERRAVRDVRERMREEWTAGRDYLGNAAPAALDTLRAAFGPRGDGEALARIDALITSNRIYAPYSRDTGSFYQSGLTRENYMKDVLVERIREAEARGDSAPRIFYKFGGLHSGKHPGARLDQRVPLGTFVSEWSRTIRGEDSFHLFLDCNGGRKAGSGQGEAGPCPPYLTSEAAASGDTSPFSKHLSDEGITLTDLSPLRPRFSDWDFLTDRVRSAIIAVDAYMTVAGVTPSTTFDRFREDSADSGGNR